MFKRYLRDLINNKKTLIAALVSIPIIIYNCTAEDWHLSDSFDQNDNQQQEEQLQPEEPILPEEPALPEIEEPVVPEQPEQIEQPEQEQEEVEAPISDLDIAYQFIKENIEVNPDEGIHIDVQKSEHSIVLVYTYNKELTEQIKKEGISESFLFSTAEDLSDDGLDVKQYIKEHIGLDVDIEVKLLDSNGKLYVYIYNDQLVELNPVQPTSRHKKFIRPFYFGRRKF